MSKELELSVSNKEKNKYMPDPPAFNVNSRYVDDAGLEEVPGFSMYDQDWEESINETELNIKGNISMLSYDEPETVCGRDDRVKIQNTTISPYKLICKLYITAANGSNYIGTGFFIDRRCIITAGHVVFSKNGGWARSIRVAPGQNGSRMPFGSETSSEFYSVEGWARDKDQDYDHGSIILPNDNLYNRVRGYFGYRQENGLPLLNNCGYPGDKRPSTEQWYNAGRATRNTGRRFEYMADTAGGQSGSPTWINSGSSKIAVGVHAHGGCPNKCIRVQGYVLDRWAEWRRL